MGIQIEYLLRLQELREVLGQGVTSFMLLITMFGEYLLPFFTFAVVYWCINKRIGAFLVLNCGFSMMINLLIKNLCCIYRPWVLDARIKPVEAALKYAGGYSFPSGHTTIAVSCWGAIGAFWRHIKGVLPCMILLCLLVAFSRNYVGVHTPQDVLVAGITAVAVLFVDWKLFCWAERGTKQAWLFSGSVLLFSLVLSVFIYCKDYPLDYVNGALLVNPERCRLEVFSKFGFVIGGFLGWILERKWVRFELPTGGIKNVLYRAVGGLLPLVLLLLFVASFCKWVFSGACACFCGLFVVSFYIMFVYPWIFSKFKRN